MISTRPVRDYYRLLCSHPSDIFNPLLVREVRQCMRSNQFMFIILLTSLVCTLTVAVSIFTLDATDFFSDLILSSQADNQIGKNNGSTIFHILSSCIYLIGCLVIPIRAGIRFRSERGSGEFDLFMITGVSVWSVIRGKLLAALVQSMLILAISAPFMVVSYLLRGISILIIFGSIGLYICASLAATQCCIFIGSLKTHASIHFLCLAAFGVAVIIGVILENDLISTNQIFGFFQISLYCLLALLLLYLASSAVLELPNKNRELFLKIFGILFLGIMFFAIYSINPSTRIANYVDFSFLVLSGTLLLIAPLFLGYRIAPAPLNVRKHWSTWKRICFAPFYPGLGPYMIWLSLIYFLLQLVTIFDPWKNVSNLNLGFLIAIFSLSVSYSYLTQLLTLMHFQKFSPVICTILLMGISSGITAIFSITMKNVNWNDSVCIYFCPLTAAGRISEICDFRQWDNPIALPFHILGLSLLVFGVVYYLFQLNLEKKIDQERLSAELNKNITM